MPLAPLPDTGREARAPKPRAPGRCEPAPPGGWPCEGAPGGRLHGVDLAALDEDVARRGGPLTLVPIGRSARDWDRAREPLVLVHGYDGAPGDLADVAKALAHSGFQLFAACYDDRGRRTTRSGDELAVALDGLAQRLAPGRPLTLVAHSMGGLVARRALSRMAASGTLHRWSLAHLVAVDSPWHGFPGPADEGFGALLVAVARPFLPDGLEDMRARSAMFEGDPEADDPVAREGLCDFALPPRCRVELAFAARGILTREESAAVLAALPEALVANVLRDVPVKGDARVRNLWRAMVASEQFPSLHAGLEGAARKGALDARAAATLLAKHFPTYPGDHAGVLRAKEGAAGFVAALAARAAPQG